jgi:hypothetical protein
MSRASDFRKMLRQGPSGGGTACPSCVRRKQGARGLTMSMPVSRLEEHLGHRRYKCAVCSDEFKLTPEQVTA